MLFYEVKEFYEQQRNQSLFLVKKFSKKWQIMDVKQDLM